MALGSIQPLTEINTRNISVSDRCVGLTTLPSSWANYHEMWEPQPPGSLRHCTGIALRLHLPLQVRSQTERFSLLSSQTQEVSCPREGAISTPFTRLGCEARPFRSV
jgi:hypothetical protein